MTLAVTGYAVAGGRLDLPEGRRLAFPPPGLHRRRARLPSLAVGLAKAALGRRPCPEETAVLIGTALGCLTETEAFVTHMLEADEATPMPRAFSSSVHNAIAGEVARAVGARGENRTVVHGGVSICWALWFALRRGGSSLVGALDERTPHVERAYAACDPTRTHALQEAAAVLALAPEAEGSLATAIAAEVGRTSDPAGWLRERLVPLAPDVVLVPSGAWARRLEGAVSVEPLTGETPSAAALSCALAVALLAGEATLPGLPVAEPRRVAVAATSRFGDVGLACFAAPAGR